MTWFIWALGLKIVHTSKLFPNPSFSFSPQYLSILSARKSTSVFFVPSLDKLYFHECVSLPPSYYLYFGMGRGEGETGLKYQ